MTNNLKPCPFCASEAIPRLVKYPELGDTWTVKCHKSLHNGPMGVNEQNAVACWNERPLESRLHSALLKVREVCEKEDFSGGGSNRFVNLSTEREAKLKEIERIVGEVL